MKKFKKLSFSVFFSLLLLMVSSTCVFAASNEKIKTLAAKKTVTYSHSDNYTGSNWYPLYYKITVPNDGYITLTLQNVNKTYSYIDVCRKDGKEYKSLESLYNEKKGTATQKIALQKGTYYLKPFTEDNQKFKLKYTFTKAPARNNYCIDKAISLKKNKEELFVTTPKTCFDKWYKIKLTKKQMLTLTYTGSNYMDVYDSNFDPVEISNDNNDHTKYYSVGKLNKGTYYIRVNDYVRGSKNYNNLAHLTTLKWK